MATVMSWGNSEGVKGRCDAKCHNAKTPKCECMCGGAYHGAALQAGGVEKVQRESWDEVLEAAKRKAAELGFELEPEPVQLALV